MIDIPYREAAESYSKQDAINNRVPSGYILHFDRLQDSELDDEDRQALELGLDYWAVLSYYDTDGLLETNTARTKTLREAHVLINLWKDIFNGK